MTAVAVRLRRDISSWPRLANLVPALLVVFVLAALGAAASFPTMVRAALAIPAAALLVAICVQSPRRSIILVLGWLAVLGIVRRLLSHGEASGGNDPLLLVAPTVVALLVLVAARRGAFRQQTRLTKSVLLLSALLVAAALNPLQGGIEVGAGGLFFVLVPMLWFWIGRALVDDQLLSRLLRLVALVSVGAALYGLFQVYFGFPTWDQRWIDAQGYQALRVGDSVRPFSSFASSSEYVGLLAIGTLLWALRIRKGRRAAAALVVLIPAWALVLASARGALVILPVALGVAFAISRGFGFIRIALAALGALSLLGILVSSIEPSGLQGSQTSALLSHQITGLADPFNPKVSSLPLHIDLIVDGLKEGFRNPVGVGLGFITIAGEKFGSSTMTTEADPSNVAVATGIPGLLAYLAVVVTALHVAYRRARRERDYLSLAALGIILITLLQWLNGGNYSVAPLPWLMLGWFDRRFSTRSSAKVREASESPVPV